MTKQTTLAVRGMSCSSCVAHIRKALAFDGVTDVGVDLERGAVTVSHRADVSTDRLVAELEAAGYGAAAQQKKGCCCS